MRKDLQVMAFLGVFAIGVNAVVAQTTVLENFDPWVISNDVSLNGNLILGLEQNRLMFCSLPQEDDCNDGLDNDGNGCIDSADFQCPGLSEGLCSDGIDNDCDGLTDCADSNCSTAPNCGSFEEFDCSDGLDNDGDGCSDYPDSQCGGDEWDCEDGIDNDCDGKTDCADPNCARSFFENSRVAIWNRSAGTASYMNNPYIDGSDCRPAAMSANGAVVVGSCKDVDGYYKASVYKDGNWQVITGLPDETHSDAFWSQATAISADGTVVAGHVNIDDSGYGGYENCRDVGGEYLCDINYHPFTWTEAGGMVDLGLVNPGESHHVMSISSDGSTVVGWIRDNGIETLAKWQGAGTGQRIFSTGEQSGRGVVVNHDGSCIAGGWGYSSDPFGAFLWQDGTFTTLGKLSSNHNPMTPVAITDDCGIVFGTCNDGMGGGPACVWTPTGGLVTFANYAIQNGVPQAIVDGWTLQKAGAMTPDGSTFVGGGFDLDDLPPLFISETHGWVADINKVVYSCELDWNDDGMVDETDYLVGSPMGGFYAEWYIWMYYSSYYPILFPTADQGRLDWDESGSVDEADLMGPLDAAGETEGYYVQWYIFSYYPSYYGIFMPETMAECMG